MRPGQGPAGPRLGLAAGEVALGVALLGTVLLALACDATGALVGHLPLLGFHASVRRLIMVLAHPADPAAAWSAAFSAWAFWTVTGLLLAPIVGAAVLLSCRRAGPPDGFATARELRGAATLQAARRQARTTRPSLESRDSAPAHEVGYPLGRAVVSAGSRQIPVVCSWEHSLELVAPPGAGKTLRVLAPILRQHPGPVLATSTKPDLYEFTAAARRHIGPVLALDPDDLCPAAEPFRWSPVAGCEEISVAVRRASALVAAAGDAGDVRSGAFFRRSAATVLSAYLHAAAVEGLTMREVCAWAARPGDPGPLRVLAAEGDGTVDWAARLVAHTSGAEETTSGVMRSVDLALACFADPRVLERSSPRVDEALEIGSFLSANGTVFALGKDRGELGGSAPLVTAFCDELLAEAEHQATAREGRRLDPPLLACLDEAPSVAPLPGLPALVADGRGRGIVVLVGMQSFSQAEQRWGRDGVRTIRNAASALVVFGGLGVGSDLEELSRLCGSRHVERLSLSEDRTAPASVSRHLVEEPVLTPAAIRSLPPGRALVLLRSLPPFLSQFPGLWEGHAGLPVLAEERAERVADDDARSVNSENGQPPQAGEEGDCDDEDE